MSPMKTKGENWFGAMRSRSQRGKGSEKENNMVKAWPWIIDSDGIAERTMASTMATRFMRWNYKTEQFRFRVNNFVSVVSSLPCCTDRRSLCNGFQEWKKIAHECGRLASIQLSTFEHILAANRQTISICVKFAFAWVQSNFNRFFVCSTSISRTFRQLWKWWRKRKKGCSIPMQNVLLASCHE